MIDRLADVPIGVHSAAWDLLWWNPLWAALTGDPVRAARPRAQRRLATFHRPVRQSSTSTTQHAEEFSDDLAADLREAIGPLPERSRTERR